MAEAFFESDLLVSGERVGVDVFDNGQVLRRGAEVLAEGEDGDIVRQQVVHRGEDLVAALPEAEHDAGFRGDVASDHLLRLFQDDEGTLVLGAGADERGEALDRFEVVVEDVRASVHDHLERPVAVVEIGDEHLDDDLGIHLADGADRFPEMLGAAIAEIVTGDGGDDDMAQVHAAGGLGDTGGLVGF